MHPPRLTIGSLLLIVAAFSVGLAALKGNHIWVSGMSMLTIFGLLGAALGACSDAGRPGPSSPGPSSAAPPTPLCPLARPGSCGRPAPSARRTPCSPADSRMRSPVLS